MGLNIGGAITGALGGFLAGGPVGAFIGGAVGAFAPGSEPSETEFRQVPETKQAQLARAKLFGLATGPSPEVPIRGIAPLAPQGEERRLARDTATELAKPVDIFSLPEVQGIIQEATTRGNLLANRIGRSLQISGTAASSGGRDILGRTATEVSKSIASQLAPFASQERQRRVQMVGILESLGLTEEERERATTQAGLDALFQQKIGQLNIETQFRPRLLESIIGLQPAVLPIIPGETPSSITEFAPLIGPLLSSLVN